ncbi:uncharacterized protein LOC136089834 [Hydra vulgaris]|uniref:ATP-dependent DNA helicase n=1 Tax=Hydra vulgaris TaxID=6087 RepID=A0ABM4DC90_HYDVU
MQLTENNLDFLIESIYKFNEDPPATLGEIRQHGFTSRQTLCQSCTLFFFELQVGCFYYFFKNTSKEDLLNHVKEKCLEIENCNHYLNECEDCNEFKYSELLKRNSKIRKKDNKKMLKLLSEQKNLRTEDEMMALKFLSLVIEQDDLSSIVEKIVEQNIIFMIKIIKKMLSLQQQKALQWLDEEINFFITGGAGCGKSYIVKEIAQSVQIYKTIHITASTGKAAHLLNGVTIHAFAGIETGVKSLNYYKRHMHPDIKKTWLETDILIIDEISMINAQTFDLLHLIACEIKQCHDELFGGIQVIACGDFFQLPPVTGEFVFKSKIWQQYMTQVLV